jgi:hypothetical protein
VKIRTAIFVASTCVSSWAQTSVAQNWDGNGPDPNVPKAATPPPTPVPKPTIIPIGPDGKIVSAPTPAATGNYYYDDAGAAAPSSNDQAVVNVGPTPALHVVRTGDTLWDICYYYFNDPWQWPKIWSYNAQISNPHWIYPGNLVRLIPRGTAAEPDTTASLKTTSPDNARIETRRPPSKSFEVQLRQTAFIEQESIDTSIRLEGAVDEKSLLATGDTVFLTYNEKNPPKVGEQYSVYVPGEKVKSKGKTVGSYVRILGTVQVTDVRKDKRARGILLEAREEIERGARLGALQRKMTTAPFAQAKVDAQGSVVAIVAQSDLIGQGAVVFVDVGQGAGIEVGNHMYIVRRGDGLITRMNPGEDIGQNDKRFPARALGEIVIVDVGKSVSMGLVVLAVQEMGVGDTVMMQKN